MKIVGEKSSTPHNPLLHITSPPFSFPRYDRAVRKFRVRVYDPDLDEIVVEIVNSWRVRFRCPHCGKVFTEYPPFATPYKRFVTQDILQKVNRYLEAARNPEQGGKQMTYRDTLKEQNVPLSYRPDENGKVRNLSRSTVWRWVGWLGSLIQERKDAIRLILEKDPKTDIHRKQYQVPKTMCRSDRRLRTLQRAANMLDVVDAFTSLFGVRFFTRYATLQAAR